MKKSFLLIISFLLTGCGAHYHFANSFNPEPALDPSKPVFIAIPEDGWYKQRKYKNTGEATAREIKRVASLHISGHIETTNCRDINCFKEQKPNFSGYYIIPEIKHWENRATEWNMRPDQLILKLTAYDIETGQVIADTFFRAKSRIFFATRGTAFELIRTPVNEFIKALYGIGSAQ